MATQPVITIDITDEDARKTLVPVAKNNASFAKPDNLKNPDIEIADYMTLEWNYSVLDGSMEQIPDNQSDMEYPIFSTTVSDEYGVMDNLAELEMTFLNSISSYGPTIEFIGDYADKVIITWYGADGKLLDTVTDNITALKYVHENRVDNYKKLSICFANTNTSFRFIKVHSVVCGAKIVFDDKDILKAELTEEVDMISNQLSLNMLEFSVSDKDKRFNMLDSSSTYTLLKAGQKIRVNEIINNEKLDMGTLYLSNFSSDNEKTVQFQAICALGILDKSSFKKGRIYENEKAGDIIDEIMQSADFNDYEVQEELKNVLISGYLPVCSHRQALQQVIFAIRAVADCSRSDKIKIYRTYQSFEERVQYDRQFVDGASIGEREFVNGVEITTHKYILSNESKKLFEGYLKAGANEILFSHPVRNLSVDNGVIIESGYNYAIVQIDNNTNCIIYGNGYDDIESVYVRSIDTTAAGRISSTVKISNAYFVSNDNVYLLAEYLSNFYSYRVEAKSKLILKKEKVGEWIALRSQYGLYIMGYVEKQVIDLKGGFLSEMKIIGFSTQDIEQIFSGKETYTGEMIGVI